jgi:hypothetical protein
VRSSSECLELDVAAQEPGALVIERAHLPLYRATVDGEPAKVEVANLHRLGVLLAGGRHRVRIWVDRRPLALSLVAAALGLVGLLALVLATPGGPPSSRAASELTDMRSSRGDART